jgi:hypothetical protein
MIDCHVGVNNLVPNNTEKICLKHGVDLSQTLLVVQEKAPEVPSGLLRVAI